MTTAVTASVVRVKTLVDVLMVSQAVRATFRGQPWWRGNGVESWDLVARVHRHPEKGPLYEGNIAAKFAQFAPTRYATCPPRGMLAPWLFLMQHYGLPTRLLDWTESPLLALYFAVWEDEHESEPGAIWALDAYTLNGLTVGDPGLCQPGHLVVRELMDRAFGLEPATDDRVVGLVTEQIDARMMMQMSGFTIHGSPRPLNGRPEVGPSMLQKFIVEEGSKGTLRQELAALGIRERTVFPDLEHLANDLARDRYA